MADPIYPAAPQAFTFGARTLTGFLIAFSGATVRRYVVHKFPKRPGQRVEDMARDGRRLEVQLVFLGDTAAKDYASFEAFIDGNPKGLLIHPIAGRWQAFCAGPQYNVAFINAINRIEVRVVFEEDELDATVASDPPDVATAQQIASAQQTTFQQTVADFLGAVAKANAQTTAAFNTVDAALANVASVAAPIDYITGVINGAAGIASSALGVIATIQTAADVLIQTIASYIAATSDLYTGSDVSTGSADATATLLGTVQTQAATLEAALIAASPTPAGAGDAYTDVELAVDACLVLSAALQAARPPTIQYTFPRMMNLVEFCQIRYRENADARAADILQLNRITNPAAIPAGTTLTIPSQ